MLKLIIFDIHSGNNIQLLETNSSQHLMNKYAVYSFYKIYFKMSAAASRGEV